MKKYILVVFIALAARVMQAQIPNAGFENWTTISTYEVPDSWGNMNTATSPTGVYTTAKGSPGASGSYFVKLTTKDAGGVITPGIIVSGQLNTTTWQPISGFPYTQQAEKLEGKYQYMGYNNDAATISAWLTRWNTTLNRRDTIASLKKTTTGMVHVWTPFSIPFAYWISETPDTAVIIISSSGISPKKNSFIWVDDLSLDGLVTSQQKDEAETDMKVFPSPAKEEINLAFNSKGNYQAKMQIINTIGKVVYQSEFEIQTGLNMIKTDLGKLQSEPGMYFIRLETPGGAFTRKFIIGR